MLGPMSRLEKNKTQEGASTEQNSVKRELPRPTNQMNRHSTNLAVPLGGQEGRDGEVRRGGGKVR